MKKIVIVDPIGIHTGMKYYTDSFIRLLRENGLDNICVASNFNYNSDKPFLPFLYTGNFLLKLCKLCFSCVKLFLKTIFCRNSWYIVYSYGTFIDFCFMVSMMFSKNRIMDVHEVVQQATINSVVLRKLFSFAYRFVNIAIVHSEKSRELLLELGFKGKILSVPHLEYNMDSKYDLTNVGSDVLNSIKNKKKNILFFGNLTFNKGLDILVQNSLRLDNTIKSKLNIIIAGKAMDNTLTEFKSEDSLFTYLIKHINDDEMKYLYKNSDFVALPYRITYQSGVLEMAFNFHTPVIVSDIFYFTSVLKKYPSFGIITGIDDNDFQKTLIKVTEVQNEDFYTEKDLYSYHHKKEVENFICELKLIII